MIDNTKRLSQRHFLIGHGAVFSAAVLVACAPAAPKVPAAPAAADAPTTDAPAAEPTVAINQYGTSDAPTVVWHGLGGADGATFATMLANARGESRRRRQLGIV